MNLPSRTVRRTLSATLRSTVALTPLLLAAPAHAQLLNRFLPLNVYGLNDEPDVTVTSRIRPGYENGGVRIGSFVVRPQLTESAGYESNVLATSNPRGSSVIVTDGSLQAVSASSRGTVVFGANVNDNRYLALTNQSYTNWNATLGGTYNLGRDTASLTVTHENQNQTPRDLDTPNLTTPLPIQADRIRGAYKADFNRLSLTPELEVARYRYDSGFVNGAVYDQSTRNRVLVTPGITAAYEFATRRSLVLVVRDTSGIYSHGTAAFPKQSYNDAVVLAGVDYDLNGIFRARALVGYEKRTFNSSFYPTIQAPIAELSLIYIPTGLTTVTATIARRIQDSADETTAAVTSTSGQISVDHELRRNVLLGVTGSVIRYDYAVGNGQTAYAAGASAKYLLNRYATVGATYDLTARDGNTNAVNLNGFTTGGNYVDHRFLVQLRLAL